MNTTTDIIKVDRLTKKFNGFTAVDAISFTVNRGEVFGSLKPNRVRREIGIIFQDPSLDDRLTAEDNLRFHGYLYNMDHKKIGPRIAE